MKPIVMILLACLLTACGPDLTHAQIRAVTDACHAIGLEYRVQSTQVICWTPPEKR